MFEITFMEWNITSCVYERAFVFFGALSAYNFVKYSSLLNAEWRSQSSNFKMIVVLSFLSSILAIFCFAQLSFYEQLVVFVASILLVLYTIPFGTSLDNLRSVGGVKIHIVAACWTLITLVLPLVDIMNLVEGAFWLSVVLRYLWIFLAILPFEISDSNYDSDDLGTLPQRLGIANTKRLGYFIFMVIIVGSFFRSTSIFVCYLIMMLLYVFFLATSSVNQSPYRTVFWVEAVPIIGWLILYLQS